jgi:hypothetical protein
MRNTQQYATLQCLFGSVYATIDALAGARLIQEGMQHTQSLYMLYKTAIYHTRDSTSAKCAN